ncbi:MAG: hypothetical protein DRR19_09010 [Candidatus Parabeggiatoa sp. nov. 1]|nr:MAG: hypothetical protein DRR19_09010 [Gammaproteobacteria bacterium]
MNNNQKATSVISEDNHPSQDYIFIILLPLVPLTKAIKQINVEKETARKNAKKINQTAIPDAVVPSANLKGAKKRKVENFLYDILKNHLGLVEGQPVFPTSRVWMRIFYFNYEPIKARDIHNIIKPTLDALQGFVYADDKDILYLEVIRLDMDELGISFNVSVDPDSDINDIDKIETETCFIIEAGILEKESIRPATCC